MSLRLAAGLLAGLLLLAVVAKSQEYRPGEDPRVGGVEAEFHMGRMIYRTNRYGGSHGFREPMWAIDYPLAEEHFLPALKRMTNMEVAKDSRHVDVLDKRFVQYPFMLMQQPARGNWYPNDEEAAHLREYLLRGGFLLVDDFHGEYEWDTFQQAIQRVFPDRPIVEIPPTDASQHTVFDLDQNVQIPGRRHVRGGGGGNEPMVQMQGPQHRRGIYDDEGRLMVIMNFNIDMGDSWEHADDPGYPMVMTGQGYRLGVNYIVYAMTH